MCIAAGLVFLAAAGWLLLQTRPAGTTVVVTGELAGEQTFQIETMDEPVRLSIAGKDADVVVEITREGAAFVEADCPDQTCKKSGRIRRAGETAVCLPARVSIRVEGGVGLDAVTH